jgi:hypothetical protein
MPAFYPVHRCGQLWRIQNSDQLLDCLVAITGTQLRVFGNNRTDLTQREKKLIPDRSSRPTNREMAEPTAAEKASGPYRANEIVAGDLGVSRSTLRDD